MLNFNFLEKSMGIVLHHTLCMIFQEKCYILLTEQISLSKLPLHLEILRNTWLQLYVTQV